MTIAYQYTADGYYVGATDTYGGPLPNNAVSAAPEIVAGHIPQWTGSVWQQVENHKGEEGYVNGEPFTIKEYGPYPEGWSTTPPPPTEEEQYNAEREAVERKYSAPWTGADGGVLTLLQMTIVAALAFGQDTADLYAQYNAELTAMNAEFETIDEKYGVN